MPFLEAYAAPESLPTTASGRIGRLLNVPEKPPVDDISLADLVAEGLPFSSADALIDIFGKTGVIGPLIPEATFRRVKKERRRFSRAMSERLYEVGRVIDAVSRTYQGDTRAIHGFINRPHPLLGGKTPLSMARSSSAGAEAVTNLLRRADASFAV